MPELNSQLWSAIFPGNVTEVQALLAMGADPNYRGHDGRTAVHRACLLNCPDHLDLLVNAGGSPDAVDDNRETPLHLAALEGHLAVVTRLLALGVDAQQESNDGSPLGRAAYAGHTHCIAELLNYGVPITTQNSWGRTPLHEASRYGHIEAARLLLRRGTKVDAVDQFGNNRTPLHEATSPGDAPLVELLLLYGANLNHRNSWGATPLHMAARMDASDVVQVLLHSGASPNVKDQDGQKPVDEAIQHDHSEVIRLLRSPPTVMSRTSFSRFQVKQQTGHRTKTSSPALMRYKEARQSLKEAMRGEGYMSKKNLELQTRILSKVLTDLGFRYHPDGEKRIERNEKATQILNGGKGYASAKEIASEINVLPIDYLLQLDRIMRHQDLTPKVQWLSPDDEPLLVIFVSHRWEHSANPDPYGTQLQLLKRMANMLLDIAVGLKETCNKRRERVETLAAHGALQAAYLVGAIASFVDTFQGNETELRQQIRRRVGFVYDFMCLPQNPRTKEEETEFLQGMVGFRRLMASAPVIVLRYPDDGYSTRSWCELEFWSAGKLSMVRGTSRTATVVRVDMWGKDLNIREMGPPTNNTSYSNYCRIVRALSAWEREERATAANIAEVIMGEYDLAFSWREKESTTPLVIRPDFRPHNEPDITATPRSFQFWYSVRTTLCHGIENEDFAEILKDHMVAHGIACTEEKDIVPTALWLLGCHEYFADYGFLVFYGRSLLRYFFEGKDLKVSLFSRLTDQLVHFKFADGEEALEGLEPGFLMQEAHHRGNPG